MWNRGDWDVLCWCLEICTFNIPECQVYKPLSHLTDSANHQPRYMSWAGLSHSFCILGQIISRITIITMMSLFVCVTGGLRTLCEYWRSCEATKHQGVCVWLDLDPTIFGQGSQYSHNLRIRNYFKSLNFLLSRQKRTNHLLLEVLVTWKCKFSQSHLAQHFSQVHKT